MLKFFFLLACAGIGLISSSLSGCDHRPCEFCSSSIAMAMDSSQTSQFLGLAPKALDEIKPIPACVTSCFADLSLGYHAGKFISIDRDYAEVDAFVPFSIDDDRASFVDASGYRFNDGKWAASVGTGLRTTSQMGVWGANVYYDYLRGKGNNDFHRVGAGVEWLNDCWDIRVNGYLPVGGRTKRVYTCHFDHLGDCYQASKRKLEYAYSGFDAEVGVPLCQWCDFSLYGAAGPYYYARTHHHHFFGGFGRLELDWRSLVSLQVRLSYDHHYETEVQGFVQLSLPLEFFWMNSCSCACEEALWAKVRRLGIILTDSCCDWSWNWNDKK